MFKFLFCFNLISLESHGRNRSCLIVFTVSPARMGVWCFMADAEMSEPCPAHEAGRLGPGHGEGPGHGWSELDEGWITCFCLGKGCIEKGRLGWAVGTLGREEGMLFQTEAKQNKQKPGHWNSSSKGLNVRPGLGTLGSIALF